MFAKTSEYKPDKINESNEYLTMLINKGNDVFLGSEDGILENINEKRGFKTKVFAQEFDYLENEEIKPTLTSLEVFHDGINDLLFVGNEKTMKVIKIRNDTSTFNISQNLFSEKNRFKEVAKFENIHSYLLNSISLNASKEFIITSDYIKIHMWKPNRMDQYYTLVDLKPTLVDGVVYVINSCKFNPYHDKILSYSSSNGEIFINDIYSTPKSQNILRLVNSNNESIKSISDFSFISENHIISRSLNNVCLFDIRNEKQEVFSKKLVTDSAELKILNGSDAIYEKFKIDSNGNTAYTGSYHDSVYSIDVSTGHFEEVLMNQERRFDVKRNIRFVAAKNDGFFCISKDSLLNYKKL